MRVLLRGGLYRVASDGSLSGHIVSARHVQCWAVHVQGRFHWRKLRGAPLATKETTDPWNLVTR